MSKREAAKSERRQRIIAAARELIKETGNAGLSMRAIAARANVAITTPYNLFGSKRAIVIALLEDIREFHERFSSLHKTDPIDRIFHAVTITLDYLEDDPEFYRTLWTEALNLSAKELRGELSTPQRYAFWWALLRDAEKAGALMPEIDHELLLVNLDLVYISVMLAWVLGTIEVSQIQPLVGHGYALTLRGAATEAYQDGLAKRVLAYQTEINRLRKDLPASAAALAAAQ